MLSSLSPSRLVVGLLTGFVLLTGCTSEKIVFRDREPFNPPPDQANGFLGYFDASTKQTTCGNCHVGHQRDWATSGHSGAFETLASSPGAKSYCYTCHTVSDKGNLVAAPAGYDVVKDAAYHDVQCENCHGPGLNHVEAPDAPGNQPLAHLAVLGTDSAASCAACHSGSHNPFVEEWSQSGHANSLQETPGVYVAAVSPTCAPCHEGRAAIATWGSTANYVEKTQPGTSAFLGVTCAVCHDPHGSANPKQLRYPLNDVSFANNLCMKCHSRRYEPVANSSRGPHAPQGAVLTGTAGWWPAGYDTTAIVATHGNPAVNPRLCAGCHVNKYSHLDTLTNTTTFSTGHLFRPVPCLDANGTPEADDTCNFDTTARTWQSCTNSGCHSSQAAAVSAFNANRSIVATLSDQIWVDNPAGAPSTIGVPDAGDQGLLSLIPTTEYNTDDNLITVAEGVLFNVRLVADDRDANGDRSHGVHNPFLAQSLLTASIQALNATYGPFPAPPARVKALMDDVNQRILRSRTQRPTAVSSR
ncbi:MAG: cytochrome c3 family protein [Gemmatimonadota bacterium]